MTSRWYFFIRRDKNIFYFRSCSGTSTLISILTILELGKPIIIIICLLSTLMYLFLKIALGSGMDPTSENRKEESGDTSRNSIIAKCVMKSLTHPLDYARFLAQVSHNQI